MMTQLFASLSCTWETWMEFQAPGLGLPSCATSNNLGRERTDGSFVFHFLSLPFN